MRILVGHNYYQQAGGEDAVFRSHVRILKEAGHDVCLYERRNDEIKPDLLSRVGSFLSLRWSNRSYREMRQLIRTFKPQVAHFHNIFFVTTPSVFYACRDEGIPVVVSLHNFRLMCVNGLFFRDSRPCEDCLKGAWFNGVKHRCYRGSALLSALAADMLRYHWRRKTWTETIDCIVTATEFSRQKYIQAGISADKISILPHCAEKVAVVPDKGNYALYAGRLSSEKGVNTLLEAWRSLKDVPLYIVGTGPEKEAMEKRIQEEGLTHIRMIGFLQAEEYLQIFSKARCIIVPSVCYENFPRVVVEAYAYGVPVIASRLGTFNEIVEDNVTGLLFKAGDAEDLTAAVRKLFGNLTLHTQMCLKARERYEAAYTPEHYLKKLISLYESLMR